MNNQWRLIESAPQDGTPILIFRPDGKRVEIAHYDKDQYAQKPKPYWRSNSNFGVIAERKNCPSHWMPIPPIPE